MLVELTATTRPAAAACAGTANCRVRSAPPIRFGREDPLSRM
jgi:hypothetical protein